MIILGVIYLIGFFIQFRRGMRLGFSGDSLYSFSDSDAEGFHTLDYASVFGLSFVWPFIIIYRFVERFFMYLEKSTKAGLRKSK